MKNEGRLLNHQLTDGQVSASQQEQRKRLMKKFLIAAGFTTFSSGAAFAHPGKHAFTVAASLYHLLTEPDHLAMMAGAAIIAAALVYKFKRRSV